MAGIFCLEVVFDIFCYDMAKLLEKRTVKRSTAELDSFALKSNPSHFYNNIDDNNEDDKNVIVTKHFRPVTNKIRMYDESHVS